MGMIAHKREEGKQESSGEVVPEDIQREEEARATVGAITEKGRSEGQRRGWTSNDLGIPPGRSASLIGDGAADLKPQTARSIEKRAKEQDRLLRTAAEDARVRGAAEIAIIPGPQRDRRSPPTWNDELADLRYQRPPAEDNGGEELGSEVGGAATKNPSLAPVTGRPSNGQEAERGLADPGVPESAINKVVDRIGDPSVPNGP